MGLVFRLRSRFRFCERKARKESCSCNQQPNNKPGYTVTFWLHNLVTLWPGYSDLVIVAFRLSNDLVGHWPSGYTVTQLQWLYGYIVTFLVIIQAHLLTEINLKKHADFYVCLFVFETLYTAQYNQHAKQIYWRIVLQESYYYYQNLCALASLSKMRWLRNVPQHYHSYHGW